ncbi:tRNA (adenosine(37)-N6)-threonylcarbamoyltransferase complex ATPase subunit type 1 TsaE [Candidatus Gracilibacteria bacterium GN02-872]|nr:tRNA (adenosine(37)-N6)-threonylcarbamoyltransferase complex ATPase subunit type 1 TsaE [Candidatus Gracilibacteria bacterium GN02-872]
MIQKYFLKYISDLKIEIKKPCLIFLRGDLGAGKTTLAKHILNDILGIEGEVTSPTYTYYNKYLDNYHFDLYRINNYDEFFAIGGEEILDNNSGVILVEWPEIIEKYYSPDLEIILKKTENSEEREIKIIKR